MKKLSLSLLTTFILGNASLWAEDPGLFLGLGYAKTNVAFNIDAGNIDTDLFDVSTDSLLFLAGYDINEYIGVEGRYYWNTSAMAVQYYAGDVPIVRDYKAESFALYAKPQYSFSILSVYALLGITMNDYTALLQSKNDTLFSWGLGAKVSMSQSFGAFIDYTDLGETDDLLNTDLSSWNLGLTYKF